MGTRPRRIAHLTQTTAGWTPGDARCRRSPGPPRRRCHRASDRARRAVSRRARTDGDHAVRPHELEQFRLLEMGWSSISFATGGMCASPRTSRSFDRHVRGADVPDETTLDELLELGPGRHVPLMSIGLGVQSGADVHARLMGVRERPVNEVQVEVVEAQTRSDRSRAGATRDGSWLSFQSFDVIHSSSRRTPSAITRSSDSPIACSLP